MCHCEECNTELFTEDKMPENFCDKCFRCVDCRVRYPYEDLIFPRGALCVDCLADFSLRVQEYNLREAGCLTKE